MCVCVCVCMCGWVGGCGCVYVFVCVCVYACVCVCVCESLTQASFYLNSKEESLYLFIRFLTSFLLHSLQGMPRRDTVRNLRSRVYPALRCTSYHCYSTYTFIRVLSMGVKTVLLEGTEKRHVIMIMMIAIITMIEVVVMVIVTIITIITVMQIIRLMT